MRLRSPFIFVRIADCCRWCVLLFLLVATLRCDASPSSDPEILARRGISAPVSSDGEQLVPELTLESPIGGWTSSQMLDIRGRCSDETVNPIVVNINGARYLVSPNTDGAFARSFPASQGRNTVEVICQNTKGVARQIRSLYVQTAPLPLKVVLTSDTDGVYTDLHVYEPNGAHVYWAQTKSPSGGLFFLNTQGDNFDKPGYGPYLYAHPAPPNGVYQIDANYWPGGAVQHTLGNLEIITNEGTPQESRRRVQRPLARPGETATLAFVIMRGIAQSPVIYVPGQDSEATMPPEIAKYRQEHPPSTGGEYASLPLNDKSHLREAVVEVALAQAKAFSPLWEPSQRDCAGLVRFAFREALKPRTLEQRVKLGLPSQLTFPPVSIMARLHFPEYPRLWRQGNGTHGAFADSEILIGHNFLPIGRSVEEAQSGDILAYAKSFTTDDPLHLMIVARSPHGGLMTVYHNGARAPHGAVRVVRIGELDTADDETWRPVAANPHFLGVYRWKPLMG